MVRSVQDTMYAVLEEKFSAELARGIGRYTTAGVLTPHHVIQLVDQGTVDQIRVAWESHGKPPAPPLFVNFGLCPATQADLLVLAGVIELDRHDPRAPDIPPFLEEVYADALRQGATLATECLARDIDDEIREHLTISRHCFEGRLEEAHRLLHDEDDPE